ncbi:hypothetical protein [Flavobacterium maritimum]|uniref:hypothetical protein n=1 Tax=Flavobacterium maritimum TaxID=3149042 RepID=UPI0032B482BA
MVIRKKIIIGFSVLFSLSLVWYLFIKENDYCISFKVKTATGTVFQGIEEWSSARLPYEKESYTVLEKKNFDFIKQEMRKGNDLMIYTWDITVVNDSVTKVNVGIKDLNHSLYNRLTAPFFKTVFKEEQIKKIKDFKEGLDKHLESIKVKLDGESVSKETFVAYISLKSKLQEKAKTMIINDPIITGFLYTHGIKITGKPYLEITNWNLDKETIDFNYCFPVDKNIKIIEDEEVKFKTLPAIKGLKATYFGDFGTSYSAWFSLLDYAKKSDIKLKNTVLEHFLSNPFNGGDEREWEAQIIIPFDTE